MKMASVSEAKNRLSALIDLVKAGETVVIVDRGTPVAQLEAVAPAENATGRLGRLQRSGLVRRGEGSARAAVQEAPPRLAPGHGTAAIDALLQDRRSGGR